MAYQLLRTNVALTGNVKLCCYITNREIERATLNPLTTSEAIVPHDINLKNSSYSRDIASYYKTYSDIFYDNIVDVRLLRSGEFKKIVDEDEFETGNVTDYQYGAKRVSYQKNGKQFSILAPVFINNRDEIPSKAVIELSNKSGQSLYSFTLDIEDSLIKQYLDRSYEGMDESFCKSILIDTSKYAGGIGYSNLRGWSAEGGELVSTTSNLPQKIFSRDLTYTEFDSLICDEFRIHKMIFPYILNFCWYFNLEDISSIQGMNIEYGDILFANVYYIDSKGVSLEIRDIDFNHYNIKSITGDENILDYLREQDVPELRDNFREHLAPTINRWSLVESSDTYIFNNYLGYDKYDTGQLYSFNRFTTTPSKKDRNLSWMNYLLESINKRESMRASISENKYENINLFYDSLKNGDVRQSGLQAILSSNSTDLQRSKLQFINSEEIPFIYCNGIKFLVNINNIPKTEDLFFDENTLMSISVLDNSTDLHKKGISKNPYVDPRFVTVIKPDTKIKGRIERVDIVVWLPFRIENFEDIYDLISDKNKKETLSKLTIRNIFPNSLPKQVNAFKSFVYKEEINGKWSQIRGELVFSDVFTIVDPIFTRPKKRLYKIDTIDSKTSKLYQQNFQDNQLLGRYYGWIQPHFLKVSKTASRSKENNYLFRRVVQGDDSTKNLPQWGNGICVTNLNTIHNSQNILYSYPYGEREEGKWFLASQIIYLPPSLSYHLPYEKRELTNEEVKMLTIKEKIGFTSNFLASLYESYYDISIDESYYIVNLKLK